MAKAVLADTHRGVAFGIFLVVRIFVQIMFVFPREIAAFWRAHLLS
jgi:hypothetical protein